MTTRLFTAQKVAVGSLLVSPTASIVASLLDARHMAIWLGAPALVLTGWTAAGHFITLDDDFPGGWSNIEGSKRIFLTSLLWLLLEAAVFAGSFYLVAVWPFQPQRTED